MSAFPARLRAIVHAATAFSPRPLRLFFEDESRLGLHTGSPHRRLCAPGVQPIQPVLPRYEYYWLFAALEPATGASLELEMPALDAACTSAFLAEFSRCYSESLNVLVWDGAPAHRAGRLRVPENVLLVTLPAYSPELNPVERLWQDVRARLGRVLHGSLAALKEDVAHILCAYTSQTLISLTHYPYLRAIDLAL